MGQLSGKTVVVVGLGASGEAAARLALAHGAAVVAVDQKQDRAPLPGCRMELGPHRVGTFTGADLVVVSPGVAAATPEVVAAREAGVDVVGELGFAWRFLSPPTVGITGTNGKSTVTHFTGTLLRRALGDDVFVGGNLGVPLSVAALRVAEGGAPPPAAVVEVSSYMLELPGDFAPRTATVLNLTPDHLARHRTMEVYGRTKARILERLPADGWGFLPAGDAFLADLCAGVGAGPRGWIGGTPGWVRDGREVRVVLGERRVTFDLRAFRPTGAHNLDHAATSATLAVAFGVDPAAIQDGLADLRSLPHRMEVVHEADGVVWIDDSKATNVESTRVGVGGLERPGVILLGGQAKGESFAPLAPLLGRHRAVVCFGGSGPVVADELEGLGVAVLRVGPLDEAVAVARSLARPGDAVLLSPGCASFDAFRNFEHRGQVFAALARGPQGGSP